MLRAFGGVLIEGPKWCGKTWTGLHHAKSTAYVDDPETGEQARLSPRVTLTGQYPRLIDEWQDAPVLWDSARRIIDNTSGKGLFIFTGSAVPPANATSHSGTGRFTRLRMRPMSLFESGDSTGTVSLNCLFEGVIIDPDNSPSEMSFEKIVHLICRGGWPGSLELSEADALHVPFAYLDQVAHSDLSRATGTRRSYGRVMALIRALARHTATQASLETVRADMIAQARQHDMMARSTMAEYLEDLKRVFVVDDLPSWRYSIRSRSQVYAKPKRHLADPSLAVAALEATPEQLLADPATTGFLFESLCVRDLRAYAESQGGSVCHYRDNHNLEADAIVTDGQGAWGAVEIKLGRHQINQAARTLLRLKDKLVETTTAPAFLAVLTASGGIAHTREDGVHVVPIDCLGP
jgi:predicted AAA+ superfamily ATPase